MSGIEAIGLALGVLPLLISAIEHYEDVLRPLSRYQNFPSKVQRFIDELETERTIFRTECQLLLATVAGPGVAAEMLQYHRHSSWTDVALNDNLINQLGPLGTTCNSLASKINGKLQEVGQKSEQLVAAIAQASPDNTIGNREWRSRVSIKLKFSFSENGLRQSMKDLRNLNKAFLTLSNQAARLDSHYNKSQLHSNTPRVRETTSHEVKKLQMVRQDSQLVYSALSRACTMHPKHTIQLSLPAECTYISDRVDSCRTCFSLAFGRPSFVDQSTQEKFVANSAEQDISCDWIWFEVESITGNEVEKLELNIKKNEKNILAHNTSKNSARQALEAMAATQNALGIDNESRAEQMNLGQSTCQNLFLKLNARISASGAIPQAYILEHIVDRKLIVHRSMLRSETQSPISLAKLISQSSSGRASHDIPQFMILSYAKSLTLAVLQFHTTPWLSKPWNSANVFFSGASGVDPQKQHRLSAPHLRAVVASSGDSVSSLSTTLSASDVSIIPNTLLFELGVMLLELAFGAPFESLQCENPVSAHTNTTAVDYLAALRLADDVDTRLGAGFASIVKKCLRCDFGCGTELDNPALQVRLYEDVVGKLERLEDGFRKLLLDD